jgi:hypothetical protein
MLLFRDYRILLWRRACFDVCFKGYLNINDRVWIRYTTSSIMKTSIKAPITNNHVRNNIWFENVYGCSNNATIILPNIDMNMPRYLCPFFNANIFLLILSVIISYLTLNPKPNCTIMHIQSSHDKINSASTTPYILCPRYQFWV